MGFVNPFLYAHPEVLNDIVNGTNLGCGSNDFKAVPRPVYLYNRREPPLPTGLDTADSPKMKGL